MSSSPSTFRTRAPNFTKEEQNLLCEVLKPYMSIIESKKTDSIKQSHKQMAWNKVASEYNSNTKYVARSVENLASCYKNLKSKYKKQHSDAKMDVDFNDVKEKELLKEAHETNDDCVAVNWPVEATEINHKNNILEKELLIEALEENNDWDAIAKAVNRPVKICKAGFKSLQKDFIKTENNLKKNILGTGGGPPPSDDNNLLKIKDLLVPQVDGFMTIYDADADLMAAFQKTQPEEKQKIPIEQIQKKEDNCMNIDSWETSDTNLPMLSRHEILKKKRDTALVVKQETDKTSKKNCNETFQLLVDSKSELVRLQTELLTAELEHKKAIMALEMQDLLAQNKYNEEKRQKELLLLDLQIKKIQQ